MITPNISRRTLLRNASLLAAGAVAGPHLAIAEPELSRVVPKGRIKQSASKWCYKEIELEDLCRAGAKLGLKGIDLLGPDALQIQQGQRDGRGFNMGQKLPSPQGTGLTAADRSGAI